MTRNHFAFVVARAVGIVAVLAVIAITITRPVAPTVSAPMRLVAVLPGPSISGQCTLTPVSGLIVQPGNRLGCGLNIDVPVFWPVLWGQFSGQLGAQPGGANLGVTTGLNIEIPGQPASGGGR